MAPSPQELESGLERERLVAILRLRDHTNVLHIIETLCEAGVKFLEITVERPEGFDSLSKAVKQFGHQVAIGAGTVLSVESVHRVSDLGVQFVVTPNTDAQVIEACQTADLLVIPGAFTPTEVATATASGARFVKLFPSNVGIAYMQALSGPFPFVKFVPTGGVTNENAALWLEAGARAVAMGSSLVPLSGDMNGLLARAQSAVTITMRKSP
jgi:2-dehydro-3-deoxyphosphogluconate aldolase / (4S)-4-hydroxy-2-oxoglutarate aldolase